MVDNYNKIDNINLNPCESLAKVKKVQFDTIVDNKNSQASFGRFCVFIPS